MNETPFTVGSLFSGIGGLDLGLERAGMEIRWQCEIDSYCRRVLAKHWPDVPCYEDVRGIDDSAEKVDLICGGFPCQPVSVAGQRKAQADPRWLWPEFARVIGLLRPQYVLVENVSGLLVRGMGFVLADLSSLGYDAEWDCISAADIGAPHLRRRVFLVANSDHGRRNGRPWLLRTRGREAPKNGSASSNPYSEGLAFGQEQEVGRANIRGEGSASASCNWWATEPDVGRVAHGVPSRVDRLRGLGNAVVPQVAEYVGRMILRGRTGE